VKITFVDNLLLKRENESQQFILQPHLGLISLIAILEQTGGYTAKLYDPKIDISKGLLAIDEELYRNTAVKILEDEPDIVGFTSLGCNFICTLKIARYLKQFKPGIPILLGGPHATVLHQEIIAAYPEFDVIVRNESEQKIVPVVEGVFNGNLHSIEGITYRDNGIVIATSGASTIKELDILPFPAYHAYPIEQQKLTSIRVEAGRGCPFSCTFCSTATFFGRSYRLKSAERLCEELDFLSERYGIREFGLTHDLFTVNKSKVIEFCKAVAKRNYKWRCSARMDCVDRELLTLMRDSGCSSIYYGIETGSPRMQNISRKKLDLDIFHDILDITLELGITPTLSFITGYPEELMEDVQATLDLLGSCIFKETSTNMLLQLHLLTPEPGTALHHTYGDRLEFDDYISDFNFPTLEDDDSEIMENNPQIFMNHHYYRSILPREFHVITVSLFEVLRSLGIPIIRFLLNNFDNSLSRLSTDVHAWAKENRVKSITENSLLLYLVDRFSYGSILTSLARYQFEVNRLRNYESLEDEENSRNYFPGNKFVRGEKAPKLSLIKDIHNCPQIIKLLMTKKKISKTSMNKKYDLVIHLFENSRKRKVVEAYRVDNYAATILKPIEDRVRSRTDASLSKCL
jgi:radical SAM superfamily enzyme YgiQ (UPF0313 family)